MEKNYLSDGPLSEEKPGTEKERAWFRDQYEHPVERKHTLDEVISWFEKNSIDFVGSIPNANFDDGYTSISNMDGDKGTLFERFFSQIWMLLSPLNSRSFTSPYVAMVCECQNRVYK